MNSLVVQNLSSLLSEHSWTVLHTFVALRHPVSLVQGLGIMPWGHLNEISVALITEITFQDLGRGYNYSNKGVTVASTSPPPPLPPNPGTSYFQCPTEYCFICYYDWVFRRKSLISGINQSRTCVGGGKLDNI